MKKAKRKRKDVWTNSSFKSANQKAEAGKKKLKKSSSKQISHFSFLISHLFSYLCIRFRKNGSSVLSQM